MEKDKEPTLTDQHFMLTFTLVRAPKHTQRVPNRGEAWFGPVLTLAGLINGSLPRPPPQIPPTNRAEQTDKERLHRLTQTL